ncbi:MAG: extracellular solute-binding protein [Lachnospiraceae bacterium]|nr:extracellular solute-binding protein [Lachnospiraceae bacterium]
MKRLGYGMAVGLSLAVLLAAGCGQGREEENSKEAKTQEPVTLDWYINYSWFTTTWGENEVSRAITDKTGAAVNFVVPNGNETEKLNSLISADTLPDLVTLSWEDANAKKLINEGKVYALNELADQYDPGFYDVVDQASYDWYTNSDGNIYAYPNSSFSPSDYETHDNIYSNQNFMVRKDIYEAIGSPDMTTPEGFESAIKAAVEMFPEVAGKPLIPIGSAEFKADGCVSFDRYLQNFLAVPYEKDGQIYDRNTDPEYIRWLKAFRKMGEEGYLSDEIFIDKRTQAEENIADGRYFCMIYQSADMMDQQYEIYSRNKDQIYIPVDGPKNSAGDDPTLPGAGINGWTITYISKNCKNPKLAIQLMTYLLSEEGQKLTYLGVEGSMYDMVDGKAVTRPEVIELLDSNRTEYDKIYGGDNAYWMLQDNVLQLQWADSARELPGNLREWTRPYTIYAGQYDASFAVNSDEAEMQSQIEEAWGITLPALLLASSDEEFDQVLSQYQTRRQELGYEKLREAETKQMNMAKEKLGIQ